MESQDSDRLVISVPTRDWVVLKYNLWDSALGRFSSDLFNSRLDMLSVVKIILQMPGYQKRLVRGNEKTKH